VLSIRRRLRLGLFALVGVALCAGFAVPGRAETKLDAQYEASLAGLPIGKGTWVIELGEKDYTLAASGMTTNLMKLFTGGKASATAQGAIVSGQFAPANYAASINTKKKTDEIRVTLSGGNVKDFRVDPPPEPNDERVPVTDAMRRGVLDPMTGAIARVPGSGDMRAPEACQRHIAVFDGRMRYDLQLSYKRMDHVQSKKGYAGPVVVCQLVFVPIGGHIPDRYAIKYLAKARDAEVWLAPMIGTRLMVPYRMQIETPFGLGVVEATQFVTTAGATGSGKAARSQ
jgi:hypothetical protein